MTAGIQNQGLNNYVPKNNATILKNVISISANWANTGATFYQNKEFTVLQDAYAIKWIHTDNNLTDNQYLYLTSSISKTIFGNYEWTNKAGREKIKSDKIQLPTKNDEIDFDFMDKFIAELEAERLAELEAYLAATGVKDYTLTDEEKWVLEGFENGKYEWSEFRIGELFEIKHYGKQRSQDDLQKDGELKYNFVMQNENNNGVIEKIPEQIGNHFNLIPWNSISAFTHLNKVYYQEEPFYSKQGSNVYTLKNNDLNKQRAKFIISAINSIIWNLEYGKNTASRLINYKICLPTQNSQPNYKLMETFISAIQKLVIKDVVLYADRKIETTKKVVKNNF